ncbi:MAG TPA: PIN domain-containing protein [Verrucomicrobiales bacterium]|nr:PIN domain-containing protein [Verrucomicrobiales bacterium]
MPPRTVIHTVRAIFLVCCVSLAIPVAFSASSGEISTFTAAILGLAFGGVVIGADILLRNLTIRSFSSGTFGLMIGIFCAYLITTIPWAQNTKGNWIELSIYLALGYLGTALALRSNRQEFSLIIPYVRFRNEGIIQQPLLVDTNIIIDGRLPGICATGFLGGTLIVPRFVLDELHVLADSLETVKRDRGRRGLECLEELKRAQGLEVSIHDDYQPNEKLVDTKLVQLAKTLDAKLLTNDANLGRVAQLQGLEVLNLNHLAQAMRVIVNAGDELELVLVKEGKDDHQAVGYLADGTMIVVNHARSRIGQTAIVTVSSALQTSAGRLIFAELKSGASAAGPRSAEPARARGRAQQ